MRLQHGAKRPVLMRADGTGGGRLRFFMLRGRAVRILGCRGGRGRRLLLRVLLRRTGRRRDRVDHDDVASGDRLRLDRRGHLGRTDWLRDRVVRRLGRAGGANRIGMGFDGFRITGREPADEVGHLLLRRRNQRILNR